MRSGMRTPRYEEMPPHEIRTARSPICPSARWSGTTIRTPSVLMVARLGNHLTPHDLHDDAGRDIRHISPVGRLKRPVAIRLPLLEVRPHVCKPTCCVYWKLVQHTPVDDLLYLGLI